MKFGKNISEMTEIELQKTIKFMNILSWTIFVVGCILIMFPVILTYFSLPREPITFTLPHENFMPYEEALYIVRVSFQFGGALFGIILGVFAIFMSRFVDIEVSHFKLESRLRGIERKLKEVEP